jgi:hypothetical protein
MESYDGIIGRWLKVGGGAYLEDKVIGDVSLGLYVAVVPSYILSLPASWLP